VRGAHALLVLAVHVEHAWIGVGAVRVGQAASRHGVVSTVAGRGVAGIDRAIIAVETRLLRPRAGAVRAVVVERARLAVVAAVVVVGREDALSRRRVAGVVGAGVVVLADDRGARLARAARRVAGLRRARVDVVAGRRVARLARTARRVAG